ncbi:MAG: class I SAM-dependent rRNA methyltransferase [Streptococcaceae bacterium]|jgi:23S rRNA (cytosine1962-C5)-methyltransferase|nr:class I SAM-dependent rRNA methyltransferase [Streptococcaceae bacterium]
MKELKLSNSGRRKERLGIPLLTKEDVLHYKDTLLDELYRTEGGSLLYLSKQNKGIGWIVDGTLTDLEIDSYIHLFKMAKASRSSFFETMAETSAFRLFNGEGDGFGGLTIDLYNQNVLIQWYNKFTYLQKEKILKAIREVFPFVQAAYGKNRFEGTETLSEPLFGEGHFPECIKENGVSYEINLDEGWMSGIFLDQRMVRQKLMQGLARKKSVLNLFSYTGAFSVASAVGGAEITTSVDLAKRSLSLTRANFMANDIAFETQNIYVMDVFRYFDYAKKQKLTYDVIVLDPPSFARNGKKTFTVAKNYGELVQQSVDILNQEGGTLLASTNAANLSKEKFQEIIEAALLKKQVQFKIKHFESLPTDFKTARNMKESNYLKVFFIEVIR